MPLIKYIEIKHHKEYMIKQSNHLSKLFYQAETQQFLPMDQQGLEKLLQCWETNKLMD